MPDTARSYLVYLAPGRHKSYDEWKEEERNEAKVGVGFDVGGNG